jgi:drug/metabolite transporter (DMT)-like permease
LPSAALRAAFIRRRDDPGMIAGFLLALASAVVFAAAGATQHSATHALARSRPRPTRLGRWMPVLAVIPAIAVSRTWWLGFALNVGGFWLHSAALHLSSITIVQALLSIQLIFTVPFAAVRTHTRPLARDWAGAVASCAGVAILVLTRGGAEQTMGRSHLVPVVLGLGVVTMATLVLSARFVPRRTRTALVGTAAGVGFSLSAVLIVVTADRLVHNGWHSLLSFWSLYALALSGVTAAVLVQDAFASGSLPAAMTAMLVADPVASWAWGAVVFDRVRPAPPTLAAMAVSALLIGVGVALLAYSPTQAALDQAIDKAGDPCRPGFLTPPASAEGPQPHVSRVD